jgi:pimeloyl-ACP methyl ester carboxylesterase
MAYKKNILSLILLLVAAFAPLIGVEEKTTVPRYFYDASQVRYELYQSNGGKPYNWLFLPGGAGIDSDYFRSLVQELDLPGNVWLIDLPGNGTNGTSSDFEQWGDLLVQAVQRFPNPVLVGHSFGGMFPLLFPELESHLKGFVILHSSPVLWVERSAEYAKKFHLPDLSEPIAAFSANPGPETGRILLEACAPYYFPEQSLEKGRKMMSQMSVHWEACTWWLLKAGKSNFSAKWIPQEVPTLIVGGKYDSICPFVLFEEDARFHRSNIEMLCLENAGHLGWIDDPASMKKAFEDFALRLK